jgi:hypothetical protein
MPFGKYAGTHMTEVPTDYLIWAWNAGAGKFMPGFREWLRVELADRGCELNPFQQAWEFDEEEDEAEPDIPPSAEETDAHTEPVEAALNKARVGEIIATGRQVLLERYLNTAALTQQVNSAAEWLEKCKELIP